MKEGVICCYYEGIIVYFDVLRCYEVVINCYCGGWVVYVGYEFLY